MIKIYLKLRAKKDIAKTSWKEGDIYEMVNDVFDEQSGIAYYPIDKEWEILKMELRDYKTIQENNKIKVEEKIIVLVL